jgi:hypothetical protein
MPGKTIVTAVTFRHDGKDVPPGTKLTLATTEEAEAHVAAGNAVWPKDEQAEALIEAKKEAEKAEAGGGEQGAKKGPAKG